MPANPGFAARAGLRWARTNWVLLAGCVAVAALIFAVGPPKVAGALDAADPGELALMLPCALLLYLVHGLAWWLALRAAGTPVRAREAIETTYASQALVLLPGGDLWRVPILRRHRPDAASGVVTGAVVFDDLTYLAMLSCAMLPALVARPHLWPFFAGLAVPQALLFLLLLWPRPQRWVLARAGGLPVMRRFTDRLEDIGPAFRLVARSRLVPLILVLQVVCALLAITLFGLGLAAVHAAVPPLELSFTYAGGQVAASIAVIPAAVGAYEGLMTGLLALQSVPAADAAVTALLYRFFNDVVMAVVGLAVAGAAELGRAAPGLPLSWKLLRVSHAPGSPRGVLRVWALVEAFENRRLGVSDVRPGGLLRYTVRAHRGQPVRLRDGSGIALGDPIVELHLDNRRSADLAARNHSPWALLRELRIDLRVLATMIEGGELRRAVALHGSTLLAAAGPRLGFERRAGPHTMSLRLDRLFFVGLLALHGGGSGAALAHQRKRWPGELWMSRDGLLSRYGARAAEAA